MQDPVSELSRHEQEVNEVIAKYLLAVDAGEAIDRSELIARHPAIAQELRSFFDEEALLQDALRPPQLRREEAWRRLTQVYGPSVYGWCRRAGLQGADAADVVQDVFAAVARGLHGFRRTQPRDSFRGWLWVVYRSKLMDFFRRQKAVPHTMDAVHLQARLDQVMAREFEATDQVSCNEETAQLVRRALQLVQADVSDNTWQAFWRSGVLEEQTSEVARSLGMTAAAVCMGRARVLRKLRGLLAELEIMRHGK